MRQMMRSDSGGTSTSRPGSALSLYGGDVYRTESPAPFVGGPGMTESPGHFSSELPGFQHQHHQQHAATVPIVFDKNGEFFDGQYAAGGGGGGGEGYQYAHPQHVSTM